MAPAASAAGAEDLARYRAKRDGGATPEPMGGRPEVAAPAVRVFVVHEHRATRRHWDLRLEVDGVLLSWAVPHGPSMDPDEKRLAVKVEAHPIEYTTFEAVIPPGNYGAGPMIVWDRGRFVPVGDPAVGLQDGEIKFELYGYKLRGAFTLVRTGGRKIGGRGAGNGNEWLLIKKRDAWTDAHLASGRPLPDTSVLSGVTADELADGAVRIADLRRELAGLGLPPAPPVGTELRPMLCEVAPAPFSHPDWLFELKYDGYRLLARGGSGHGALQYRSGRPADRFPELAAAIRALPCPDVILDGEVVVLDTEGAPSFQLLQQRAQLRRAADLARMSAVLPVTYFAFDMLACDGHDLRTLPLRTRKAFLQRLMPAAGPLRYAEHIDEIGTPFFAQVQARGLEGLIGKLADSPYRGRRSGDWLKIKVDPTADFAICGYTPPKGSRSGLGALHLCVRTGDGWVWAGKVGTGLDDKLLAELRRALDAGPPWTPTFPLPEDAADARWCAPTLVCEVRYREWPEGHAVRLPVFVRLRDDKLVTECTMPARRVAVTGGVGERDAETETDARADEPPAPPPISSDTTPRDIKITNRDKVFFPAIGDRTAITKGELVDYYRAAAPYMLPYLRDRPAVLTRFPDGIDGPSFYQKDMPEWTPPWLRTTAQWSEHSQREVHYLLIDDADGLAYLANLGSIPIHVWSSRTVDLGRPDWSIIDLDPKNAPQEDVVPLALAIHALCDELGLPNYVKTSGQTGLHVLIPLGGQCTHEQARHLAYVLSMVIEREHFAMATTNKNPASRAGKVYLDWGQNAHGQLLVAPLVVRPVPTANVSMPLQWHEVVPGLQASQFTLRNALDRMAAFAAAGGDPLRPVLTERADLATALTRLGERLGAPARAPGDAPPAATPPKTIGSTRSRWKRR
jgi:bifunctional non-homologous end joining protein LigD